MLGMGAAMLTAVLGQKLINFQEQEICHAAVRTAYTQTGLKTHTMIQHRGFLGDSFYCAPLYEVR